MNASQQAAHPAERIDHVKAVAEEADRFAGLLKGADLGTQVPGCPGWTLTDLVRHTGSVQRWFSVLLSQRVQTPPTSRDVELRLPATDAGYPDWLVESAAEAARTFAATDLEAPMWAWGLDQHARFWVRRMLFETLVHRADAEIALGMRPGIDRVLAVDGLDEFLVNLPFAERFAPKVANLRGADETIRFRCTDGAGDWVVRLRADGFGLVADPSAVATADATLQGTAAELLLLAYGRLERTAGSLQSSGDQELLTRWFANSEF
ncbi:maleylpyruvate isomerase family mycothiol-dependent enzyme [Kitasatospora mediocidica]|uniref:maleylpyruvate isomerase family mycothiol-dependent enzyme n=1 Tax=Kitasatospora mediocidica TaxID=58352 RepID=UPI00055E08DF|nr:maleylpyruvate isomerase family mycothiol-dependent enzyme [Kitasatospora mediocidica]